MTALKDPKFLITLLITVVVLSLAAAGAYYYTIRNNTVVNTDDVGQVDEQSYPELDKLDSDSSEYSPQYINFKSDYDLNDIQGEPNKKMFPDISDPQFLPVSEETKIEDKAEVAVFGLNGDYRAYPLRYIIYHHLVNDTFGDKPVLISYCAICNSAIAFERTLDGKVLTFGVLGVLLHNDLAIYDKETDSWWAQITGDAIKGTYKGKRLEIISGMEIIPFSKFKESYPEGKVLQPVQKNTKDYRAFSPFYEQGYNEREEGTKQDYEQVLGIEVRQKTRIYRFEDIAKEKVINDELNGWAILVVEDPDTGAKRIFRRFILDSVLEFSLSSDGYLVDDQTGSKWDFEGKAIEGPLAGQQLIRPAYLELYRFAWFGFYPDSEVYKP